MARRGDAFDEAEAGQGESRMHLYIAVSLLGFGTLGALLGLLWA